MITFCDQFVTSRLKLNRYSLKLKMASDHGKWETVVSKKKGHVSRNDVRKAKQSFLDNASSLKADFKNPLEEGETIYEAAFKDKENKDPGSKYPSFHQVDLPKKGENAQPNSPKKLQQKHKKQHKAQKPSPLEGIEERISKISHDELSIVIKDVQERFSTHPIIWLKEIASWLQKQLPGAAEKDLMLTSKPKGFPLSSVGSEVKKELNGLLAKCSDQSIENVLCFCITMIMDELQQGRMTIGLRILLQLLISYSPRILMTKMDEILNGRDNSQESFLTIIWTFNHFKADLRSGLKVWWNVMFPVIRVSSHSHHVVNYIEELISKHEETKFNDSAIDSKKFYDVLNLVFSSKSPLANSPSLKSRMDALYPKFKRMYFSDKPSGANKDKFNKLLIMLNTADADMQTEVLRLLVFCLSKDSKCFDAWLANIESTLKPSSVLWDYMFKNSDDVLRELINGKQYKGRDILREKADQFLVELRHIKRKGNGSKIGFAECYDICNNFQEKEPVREERRFTLWKLSKYLMLGVLALVFIDIYSAKGYKGSKTEAFAVNFGVDKHVEASLIQLEGMAACVGRWSKANVPKYYAKVSPYIEPAMETTWKYSVKISKSVHEFSKPGLDFISKQTEWVFEKVDEVLPGYVDKISENANNLWNFLVPTLKHYMNTTTTFITTNTPIVTNQIVTVLHSTCTSIYQLHPAFFDKASMHLHCAFNCTRRYLMDTWQIIVENAPIIMDALVEYMQSVLASIQYYCTEGQIWLQNTLRSSTGGGNTATS